MDPYDIIIPSPVAPGRPEGARPATPGGSWVSRASPGMILSALVLLRGLLRPPHTFRYLSADRQPTGTTGKGPTSPQGATGEWIIISYGLFFLKREVSMSL